MQDNIVYQVGDRVMLTREDPGNSQMHYGMLGTVVGYDYCWSEVDGSFWLNIRWDELSNGHDCGGKCEWGHGWNLPNYAITHFLSDPADDIGIEEEPSALDFFLS